jgi:2-polyprenyl-6-methoxyphenol hydroxylase-like FAD-dependent oxidoreductase
MMTLMSASQTKVLISGAGIAGPVLAYWLSRCGYAPTVVERAPELRIGGHPVDLWGSAVEVAERMGVLPALQAERTMTDVGVMISPKHRAVEIDLKRLMVEIADRHIEIMRGRLVSVLYERSKAEVEYIFGDSIAALDDDGRRVRVRFESGATRDFALVIGADGQHSNVRRLAFGEEDRFARYLGGYICGYTMRNELGIARRIHSYMAPDRMAVIFPIRQTGELGVGFLFRRERPVELHHDDTEGQKRLVREVFAGEAWEVPRLLDQLNRGRDFYFDSFSQIRMESWTRGRIALVGDAGYGPAPAVGGGSSLAVVAAYILAGALAEAGDDQATGFRNYERAIRDMVVQSQEIGPAILKTLIARSEFQVWLRMRLAPLITSLPHPLQRLVPMLPRRARVAMRAVAAKPIRTYAPAAGATAAAENRS